MVSSAVDTTARRESVLQQIISATSGIHAGAVDLK
jgi:hypothetical protein